MSAAPGKPLRVLVAGAAKVVVQEIRGAFEAGSGRSLDVSFDTVGVLRDRVLGGEAADVAILSAQALEAVAAKGLSRGESVALGQTGVALGGRRGMAPAPMDTPERFRDVLLTAKSIGYADPDRGATAGRHFRAVLERMGLKDALANRLRMFPFGVEAIDALVRGEVEIAVSQATEILTHDVVYLGPFPEPYGLATAYGAAALSDDAGARAFLALLEAPETAPVLRRTGFF
ncbi:MAG TPA: substrate-binding domain-containing protein [Microvirga sp.]|jgi:molybdate transport system substrate-binding protein|nr:substrate-binding domain-containing protein [Microvirga sp.]